MTLARFPFTAVVGQEDVKLALTMNALDPRIGGVLLRGDKGSAKSTLARGLAAVLPGAPPFVELPIGASEDRVTGTLDIEAALTTGRRRFHPGLLAEAHGGVLYVDEVNLLPDHLVDVLLDVAASGVNRVEREGVSESHAARFVLVGSMNPEEGDLRPQLLDRFGFSVEVAAPLDATARAEAVRRRLAFDADPEGFARSWQPSEADLADRLAQVRPARLPENLLDAVSQLCASVGAQGLRADLVICRAAAALAGWEGRAEATVEDVRRVAHLALAHRRRRGPLEQPGIDQEVIDEALDGPAGGPGQPPRRGEDLGTEGPTAEDRSEAGDLDGPSADGGSDGARQPEAPPPDVLPEPAPVIRLGAAGSGGPDEATGRRSSAQGLRGRLVGDRAPQGPVASVALGATARAAATRRALTGPEGAGGDARAASLVQPEDLREAVREQRVGNLVILVVDASASMGVERRMAAARGAVVSLLLDAYQRRDRVALVTFRDRGAEVVLRPTGSVEVARARLAELPTGGRTPLAAGIRAALELAGASRVPHRPLLVLVSDGRATAAEEGEDPVTAALQAADEVRRRGIGAVVIDVEDDPITLGLAPEVAARMGAVCLTLPELSGETLAGALREVVAR